MFERFPAIQLLHQLQVEQTTPTGTVVFLAVMVAVFMLGAVALYVAAITGIWYVRFRSAQTPLHRVFLPSAAQFREHAAEYSLAIATSLILMLSLTAKHATVEHIKATLNGNVLRTAQDCRGALDVGHLFPLHTCPEQLAGVGMLNLLQVTADQGQTSEAQFVVERLYRAQKEQQALPLRWITEGRLRFACLLLLLLHVSWLVRGRFQQLAASPEGGEPVQYADAARPLLALSVCAALLLLAAPAVLPTEQNVASATIASIRDDAARSVSNGERASDAAARPRDVVEAAFESQRHNLALLEGDTGASQNGSFFGLIATVRDKVNQLDATVRAEDAVIKGQVASLDEVHRRDIDALRAAHGDDRERLASMDTVVQSHVAGIRDLREGLTRVQSGLQASIGEQQDRLNDLEAALRQARTQIDQASQIAQSARDSVNSRMTELAGSVSQLQAGLRTLGAQMTNQVQSVSNDLASGLKAEAQARSHLTRRLDALEGSGQNLDVVSRQIARVESALNALTARVNGYHPSVITRVPGVRDSIVGRPAGGANDIR